MSPAWALPSATGSEHGDAASVHADGVVTPPGGAKRVVAADAGTAPSANSTWAIGTTRANRLDMVGVASLFRWAVRLDLLRRNAARLPSHSVAKV